MTLTIFASFLVLFDIQGHLRLLDVFANKLSKILLLFLFFLQFLLDLFEFRETVLFSLNLVFGSHEDFFEVVLAADLHLEVERLPHDGVFLVAAVLKQYSSH